MKVNMQYFPQTVGFYKRLDESTRFIKCPFADSKQITSKEYELQHDLFYRAKDGRIFVIRKGFIHDGASKGVLTHFGKFTNPAILHDGLYSIQHDRSDSDSLFDESMEVCGVSWIRRNTYWFFVRVGGWSAFTNQKEEDIQMNKKYITILGDKQDG